jgi:tetratricopeptide (TPR) repeat protein
VTDKLGPKHDQAPIGGSPASSLGVGRDRWTTTDGARCAFAGLLARPIALALAVAAVALAVHMPAAWNGFVFDDHAEIEANRAMLEPFSLRGILLTEYWGSSDEQTRTGWYRPVPLLVQRLTFALYGTNPLPYHLLVLLIHTFSAGLLAWTLAARFSVPRGALVAGILFGVHTVHTEAVSTAYGLKEVLACFFSIAALAIYAGWTERAPWSRLARLIAAGALLFLAVLSKESAAPLPAALIAADLFRGAPFARWRDTLAANGRAAFFHGAFLAASVGAAVSMRFPALGGISTWVPLSPFTNPIVGLHQPIRLAMGLRIAAIYGRMLVWPVPFSVTYTQGAVPVPASRFAPGVLAGLALVALLVFVVVRSNRLPSPAGIGAVWTASAYLLASNLVVPFSTMMSERFLYLPSVGLAMMLAAFLDPLLRRSAARAFRQQIVAVPVVAPPDGAVPGAATPRAAMHRASSPNTAVPDGAGPGHAVPDTAVPGAAAPRSATSGPDAPSLTPLRAALPVATEGCSQWGHAALVAGIVIVIVLLSVLTIVRTPLYGDDIRLMEQSGRWFPGSVIARLAESSRLTDAGKLDEARRKLETLRADYPDLPALEEQLAMNAYNRGAMDESLEHYARAARTSYAGIDTVLAYAETLVERGRADDAIRELNAGFRAGRGDYRNMARARELRGALLLKRGRMTQALADLRLACALDPALAGARFDLASALDAAGDESGAEENFRRALAMKPDDPQFLRGTGRFLLQHRRGEEAVPMLERLLALKPDDAQTASDLGTAFIQLQELDRARQVFETILARDPSHPVALATLGSIDEKEGRFVDAVRRYESYLASNPREGSLTDQVKTRLARLRDQGRRDSQRYIRPE